MSHHDKIAFTDPDKVVCFKLRSTDASGCSTRFKELETVQMFSTNVDKRMDISKDFYRTIEMYHDISACGRRAQGFFYTNTPEIAPYLKPNTKAVFGRNKFFKMYMEGRDCATFIAPREQELLPLTNTYELLDNLPMWCLRPEEVLDPQALFASGFLRQQGRNNEVDPECPWRKQANDLEYPQPYGSNTMHIREPDGGENVYGQTSTAGYWGNGYAMSRMTFGSSYNVEYLEYTEHHKSDEWRDTFNNLPWWVYMYMDGKRPADRDDLIEAAIDTAADDLNENAERDLVAVGGNWNCASSTDAIRVICAFADSLIENHQVGEVARYEASDGTPVYVALLPYVYESPQHADHPCCCMFFSLKPIVIREVSHDTV